jgi:xylulokinase
VRPTNASSSSIHFQISNLQIFKLYFLGIDLGSSFVKASIIEADSGKVVGFGLSPVTEMPMESPQPNWAEQDPELWWTNVVRAVRTAIAKKPDIINSIAAIGISYQMHGLVVVDKNQQVLRPSIIWCDSRAVQIGEDAYRQLGETYCLERLLNSPGNFTASKLKWVKDNEPGVYAKIHKAMLPGDYLAMRLTGEINTTISGLSEGIIWDYPQHALADKLLNHFGLDKTIVAQTVSTFSDQGTLTAAAAEALGLKKGTPITYRAGDQPNNAFALNVLQPGEIAATSGTSGVIYAVVDKAIADRMARLNTFVHVHHSKSAPRYGVLMCVNGAGSMNSRLRSTLSLKNLSQISYDQMNAMASTVDVGSDGLIVLPFGNGAERILGNKDIGASTHGFNINRHTYAHVCRATQEGIAFALGFGFEMLREIGIRSSVIRAGHANMFLSPVFCETFAMVTGMPLELFDTDGSQGAARGAGVGVGHYKTPAESLENLERIKTYEPGLPNRSRCLDTFTEWKEILMKQVSHTSTMIG